MASHRIKTFQKSEPHFITITVKKWIDIFTKPEFFEIIISSLKFYQEKQQLTILGYVIMTNHIHIIASSPDLIKIINGFKTFTCKEIKNKLKYDNRSFLLKHFNNGVWQKTNYPEIIYSKKFFEQKLNYIHNNPVVKNYVDSPEDWVYSSARNYINYDHSIITIDTDYWY